MSDNYLHVLLVGAILLIVASGCDGFSRISGHVYDMNDQPIADAKILFEDADAERAEHPEFFQARTETDTNGRFRTGITHAPFNITLRLTVTKDGFRPYVTEFSASDARRMVTDKHELMIVMENNTTP